MTAGERSVPPGMVEIRRRPDETADEFADRVVMTAPALSRELQVRLRQLLPPVRPSSAEIEPLGRAS